jgi:hypothetical protein
MAFQRLSVKSNWRCKIMKTINAQDLHFKVLNDIIKEEGCDNLTIDNCIGQRYIAAA